MVGALRRRAQRQRDLRAGLFRYGPSRRRRVDGVGDDATIGAPSNGVWRFVLRENPGRSRGETIDSCAALYESMRCHLETVALLQRERCGRGAERERMVAGGYCSKEDEAQHIGGFLLSGTMRMVTATSARASARPGVALVRESTR